MDLGESKKMSGNELGIDIDTWRRLYQRMHDNIRGYIMVLENGIQTTREGAEDWARMDWDKGTLIMLDQMLEIVNLIVERLPEHENLMDFVRVLKKAHDEENVKDKEKAGNDEPENDWAHGPHSS